MFNIFFFQLQLTKVNNFSNVLINFVSVNKNMVDSDKTWNKRKTED